MGKYSNHAAIPPVLDLVPATVETCHVVEWAFLFHVHRIPYPVLQVIVAQLFPSYDHLQCAAAEVLCKR